MKAVIITPYVRHADLDIYYETRGSRFDPAIVLISSLGTDHSMWDAVAFTLSSSYFVITMDHRGHGPTGCRAEDFQVSDLAGDVLAVTDELNVRSFKICGFSLGGIIDQGVCRSEAQNISCARLVELEAGHISAVERPGQFARIAQNFLQA